MTEHRLKINKTYIIINIICKYLHYYYDCCFCETCKMNASLSRACAILYNVVARRRAADGSIRKYELAGGGRARAETKRNETLRNGAGGCKRR